MVMLLFHLLSTDKVVDTMLHLSFASLPQVSADFNKESRQSNESSTERNSVLSAVSFKSLYCLLSKYTYSFS